MKKIFLAVCLVFVSSADLRSQTAFYEGKTIRMIVGFSPGGSNDLWTRLIAQHMGKYVPGNPEFVVQNVAGGGSMVAANQVYSVTKPDGLTLANIAPALYLEQLAGRKEVQFDWAKFSYSGVVTEFKWVNPHVHITIDIKAGPNVDSTTVGTWDVEGGSTNIMGRQGWNRVTFKAGDPITLVGHPMKDGSKGISLFYVIMPDGKRLYHDIARPKGEAR